MPICNLCNDSGFIQGTDVEDVGKDPTKEIIYATVQPCSCRQQQTVPAKVVFPAAPERKEYKQPKSKKKSRGWWDG